MGALIIRHDEIGVMAKTTHTLDVGNFFLAYKDHRVPNLKRISGVKLKDFALDYELQEEIGKGSYSIVYKCKLVSTGSIFAVKVSFNSFFTTDIITADFQASFYDNMPIINNMQGSCATIQGF